MTDSRTSKDQVIAEMISVMESARDHGERYCEDLVHVHVGHICTVLNLLNQMQRHEQALRDIIDPIGAMKRDLPDGYRLDGFAAVHAAGNPQTYKDIARKALDGEGDPQ